MTEMSKSEGTKHKYSDMINLPHHVSKTRVRMSMTDRAAQFSPFAALTGYDAAVQETARLTEERGELDGERKLMLNEKLQMIRTEILHGESQEVTITFFQPDERKCGGAYVTVSGVVKKIDEYARTVTMRDSEPIYIDNIYEIEFL